MRWMPVIALAVLFSCLTPLAAAEDSAVIGDGRTVKIDYQIRSEGQIMDSTAEQGPYEFEFGKDEMLPAVQAGIEGMRSGEKKTLTLSPEDGFGPRDPEAVIEVDRSELPEGDIEPGMVVTAGTPSGQPLQGMVVGVEGEKVTLDFNHPLAGKTLEFDITVLEVR